MSTKFATRKNVFAAALLGAAVLATAPLHAANADDLTIKFKSYMLASDSAANDLYNSIEAKVENYCEASGVRALADRRAESECVATMLDATIAKIDHQRLNTIHKGQQRVAQAAP